MAPMPTITPSILLLFLLCCITIPFSVVADTNKEADKPCSAHSPLTGAFYDLRPLNLSLLSTKTQTATNESYRARGYDYGSNFTLNICGPVVEPLDEVEGLSKLKWQNVSAYYKDHRGDIFSIGQQNELPIFRGKKLLLNYTGGSPCPELDEDGMPIDKRSLISDNSVINDKAATSKRYKSTLLSFICDTSPSSSTRPAISFLGSPDHCTYVFEVRSRYACAGATPSQAKGTLGPAGVFGMIFGIGVLVYLVGGIVYQRSVMHQRGWRQLPNYALWAGLYSFFSDMFIILFSSCTNCMPSMGRMFGGKRGYHRVGTDDRRTGTAGRGRTPDDENRLIDDLNEEWD